MIVIELYYSSFWDTPMKSITIHGLDSDVASRLERQARETSMSLNKTIKKLLAVALGLPSEAQIDRRGHFEDLCGVWSKSEAKAFSRATQDMDRVDSEDWE